MSCQLTTIRIQLLSVCLLGLTNEAIRAETVWDLTDDFSKTSNPTGAWSYGTALSGTFTLYDTTRIDRGTDTIWQYATTASAAPHLWKNESGATVTGNPNGSVSLHPGPSPETQPSIARWTAPLTGSVTVNGQFGAGDGGLTDARIKYNDSVLFESLDFSTDQPFSFTQNVTVGDTIDWVVSGAYGGGNTPLTATVTAIPEPASLLIGSLVTGCGIGVGWHRRRKKRRRASTADGG
ncbi:MAG: hypothetical protein VX346_18155 [Planctomycetota bacterium]|nr:hypothetical protein [Planctomycetota bacterium]